MTISQISLTVSQLTQAIKLHLEKQFPKVVVQGEVSNFKKQSSNHLYFTLKDAHSQIQCAMFQSDARLLKEIPKDGDQIEVCGDVNVYPPRGNYQIIVRSLKKAGLGDLLQLLEERKQKFLKQGYFDLAIKKKLPAFPKKIGIITSPTGAVISDILQILDRRAFGYHVILNPVKVQGAEAAAEISRAIDDFNQHQLVDVLIVGRGGGSIEDLWAFNEESVVTSIYKSQIPVITAIGHETDTTLSDLAADLRAPTPSAAAELVLAEKNEHLKFLEHVQKSINSAISYSLRERNQKLNALKKHPFFLSPQNIFRIYEQKVDEVQILIDQAYREKRGKLREQLNEFRLKIQAKSPTSQIQNKIFKLNQIQEKLNYKLESLIKAKRANFETVMTHLLAIDPKKLLEKGYTILFDQKSNCAIVSVKEIALKQKIKLILKDGTCEASIDGVHY